MDSTPTPAPRERAILTPSALNALARSLVEGAFPLVWVEGELSNVSRPVSGHLYFTLKDAAAQVRAAMFKPRSTYLRFRPTDGQRVLVRCRVSLYETRGEFQLIVDHMEEAGEGALRRQFEALKAQLAAEGLFDADRKRDLPALPRRIGMLTSPTGAAVRDVLTVLRRRMPLVEVEILPVPVQGDTAAAQIRAMLDAAGRAGRHDVLLLTRGGGSLEDLWCFNDEALARAIAACPVPVVSAVGHEVDFTIADFVADLRAPTPSAAAELLVPDAAELTRELIRRSDRASAALERRLRGLAQRTDLAHARLSTAQPARRLAVLRGRLEAASARLARAPQERLRAAVSRTVLLRARLDGQHPKIRLARAGQSLGTLRQRLLSRIAGGLEPPARRLAGLARALNAVSPLATLARGYAIARGPDGRPLRSPEQAPVGTTLRIDLAEGAITAESRGPWTGN
ncbi:MAG: exodeoxyribonuclease VII large subunit [Pseudomonadota bacterium]